MNAQVRIGSLVKEYGTLRALNGISFHIQSGEWVALMGPSGSGKTTLINILGGLDTLTSGHVIVDGVDLAEGAELGEAKTYQVNEAYPWRGVHSRATDRCAARTCRR